MAKVVTSIRVDDKLWKRAKIHAVKTDETMTDMIERLLEKELDRRKKEGN